MDVLMVADLALAGAPEFKVRELGEFTRFPAITR